jgi:NAD(P)-dependent dehydrogenase (short-subunit alcohol dehydrogenase family)
VSADESGATNDTGGREDGLDNLAGRVVVITGGASGIGLASAHAFARAGMKVALADTDQVKLDQAVAALAHAGTEAIGTLTDVGDRDAVERLAQAVWDRFGGAHVLFNNAGVAVFGRIDTLDHSDWQWSMRVNLWGAIHGVEAFLPRMLAQDAPGHIVNCASFAGLVPSVNMAPYNVAKAGVVALTESLRKDLRGTPVSASVLFPMRVATNVWQTSALNRPDDLGGAAAFRSRPPAEVAQMTGGIADADSVAEMVVAGVRKDQLYIHTHAEARPILRRRFDRLDAAFGSDQKG